MPLNIQTPTSRVMENPNDYDKKLESPKRINQHHNKLFKETFGDLEVTKDFIKHYLPKKNHNYNKSLSLST